MNQDTGTEIEQVAARHTPPETLTVEIPLALIDPSPTNPRKRFDEEALTELATSIKEHGLIEPVVVRPQPGGERFWLIAGERRWRASQLAELTAVPARIMDGLDDAEALKIQLIENLQRQDLDPIEEAEGYRQLHQVLGLTQTEIAASVNRSHSAVAHALRLLELPDVVQDHVREGRLSVAHGKALAKYAPWPDLCAAIATKAIQDELTSKVLEAPIGSNGGLNGWPFASAGLLVEINLDKEPRKALKATGITVWGDNYWAYSPDVDRVKTELNRIQKEHEKAAKQRLDEARKHVQERVAAQQRGEALDVPAGDPVIRTGDLPRESYRHLGFEGDRISAPAGCPENCACRVRAIDNHNRVVIISMDPEHIDKLERAAQRQQSKAKREEKKGEQIRLREYLESAPAFDRYGLAILAYEAINQSNKATTKRLIERHCAGVLSPEIADTYQYNRPKFYAQLVNMPAETLVRILVEAHLEDSMRQHLEYGYGSMSETLSWYMHYATKRRGAGESAEAVAAPDDDLAEEEALVAIIMPGRPLEERVEAARLLMERHGTRIVEALGEQDAGFVMAYLRGEDPFADLTEATVETEPAAVTGMDVDEARKKAWSYLRKHGYSITKRQSLDDTLNGELLHILRGHWDAAAEPGWDWPAIMGALKASRTGSTPSEAYADQLAALESSKTAIAAEVG